MAIPLSALPPEKDLVIKLDCWTAGIEDEGGDNNHSGLTLAGLVEVFSRKEREASPRWQAVSGPVRLADLKGKKN